MFSLDTGFLNRRSEVRVLPGPPVKILMFICISDASLLQVEKV
jgi:hypothetical protein